MRFLSALLPFSFLLATPISLVSADGASIGAAINQISEATTDLQTTVANFNGNPLVIPKILLQSSILLADINKATAVAQSSANLTDVEALTLAAQVQALATTVTSTLDTIVAKKPVFARELLAPGILLNLKLEKAATDRFSQATVSKVPVALQPIAASLIAPIDTAFDNAINEYTGVI
ncbi:MAG: hypothetical protein Q9160_001243 [Pyrenula sp. 1 TL-2023]